MIKFLVMDVDGTLTDGKVYMGNDGEIFKAFSVKDGCGIKEILPQYGIIPVIITVRNSRILLNRCEELGIKECYQGERKKLECLERIIDKYCTCLENYSLQNVAYIGDDIMDLQCIISVKENFGITGCPANAVPEIIEKCDFISKYNGGDGAVREFIDYIIENK